MYLEHFGLLEGTGVTLHSLGPTEAAVGGLRAWHKIRNQPVATTSKLLKFPQDFENHKISQVDTR